ncbi:MAG: LmeA family phospholipid-binding protein [Acidimicrobiia bacterium]
MIRKLVFLAVLTAGLVAADFAARAWAESKLAEQAAAYYPPSGASSASIRSFPFLGRLVVGGDVPGVTLRMENVQADVLLLSRMDFDLSDVVVDQGELFSGRVQILDVGAGRIEALVDGSSLARAVGLDVRFTAGEVEVHRNVGGVDVFARGRVTLEGNRLRIEPTSVQGADVPASTFAVSYDIPGVELLPCAAEVRPVPEGLVISCALEDVPPVLVQGVGSARGRAPR